MEYKRLKEDQIKNIQGILIHDGSYSTYVAMVNDTPAIGIRDNVVRYWRYISHLAYDALLDLPSKGTIEFEFLDKHEWLIEKR